MTGRNTVILRVCILVGAIGGLLWFFLWSTGRTYLFETVKEDVLYRCSVRDAGEFAAAALKVNPQGLLIAGTREQFNAEGLNNARDYAHRNKIRVSEVEGAPDEVPTPEQISRFIEYVAPERRHPILMADNDGRLTGMLAAAYRLKVMKLPLPEVEKFAEKSGTPSAIVQQVKAFAEQYAAEMNQATTRTTAPKSGPAPGSEIPLGPVLPQ